MTRAPSFRTVVHKPPVPSLLFNREVTVRSRMRAGNVYSMTNVSRFDCSPTQSAFAPIYGAEVPRPKGFLTVIMLHVALFARCNRLLCVSFASASQAGVDGKPS
jgi:hypothetical protein